MLPAFLVIALAAGLMGSAATDGGKAIQNASNKAQAAIVQTLKVK